MNHVGHQGDAAQGDAVLDQRNGHDDAGHKDDHKQDALIELRLRKLRIGPLNLEEQKDGDEAAWCDVKQRENALALEQQQADEAHAKEHAADDQPFRNDVQVRQRHQGYGHPKEDKEECSDDKGRLKRKEMIIAVQFVHAVVVEQFGRRGQPLQPLHF